MALKNLMVHLDSSARTGYRLDMAASLARQHQARLVGVFGQLAEPSRVGVVSTWPSAEYTQAAQASKAMFEKATAGLADADWLDINRGSDVEVRHQIIEHGRCVDLVILGQYDEMAPAPVPADLCEEVIVKSGRPVLVVPFVGDFPSIGTRPLIAWSDMREAVRAINDGLPLIQRGADVLILSSYDEVEASCQRLLAHLRSHGIEAKTEVLVGEEVGVMDQLLNKAGDFGADLLIMGAHSHGTIPFGSRGSGTKYILGHMTVPVLMSC